MMSSASLPRRYESQQANHKHNNGSLLVRLIRHFSSHSIATSSPTHTYEKFGHSSLDRRSSTRKSSFGGGGTIRGSKNSSNKTPSSSSTIYNNNGFSSSVSNGDIRANSQQNQQLVNLSSLSVPICGIKNHGNTCFMNAILQCLSNTDLFAEYFVMGHFRTDLMHRTKLHAKKYGTRGEVTDQLALLLKALWSNQYSTDISCKFKQLVSKYGVQYEGSDQHDAQEFLLWLLDKVHEDLNTALKKKYKKHKSSSTTHLIRSDDVIAAETLANHMRCNTSFIHDLFQAQLRSSLVCRSCGKHSNTFDPYLCLSLPVPTRQTHTIVVNVTYLHKSPKEVKIAVSIESQATLRELRDKISRLIKVPEKQLVLLVVGDNQNATYKELSRDMDIIQELLDDMQEIYGIETPQMLSISNTTTDRLAGGLNVINSRSQHTSPESTSSVSATSSSSPIHSGQQLILAWRNCVTSSNESHCKFFGPFYTCKVTREASFKHIQAEMMTSMQTVVKKGVDSQLISESVLFAMRVAAPLGSHKNYLPDDVDHPLYMPCVDRALQQCERKDYRGPLHLKLIVEWDSDVRQSLLIPDVELSSPALDSNIEYVKARTQKANRSTLQDCFDIYFREEKLAANNAWMCPACKRHQQCIKKLSLWSAPDVLIIHLKRFRQLPNAQRSKISTLVLFPLSGLDIDPYLAPRKQVSSSHSRSTSYSHTSRSVTQHANGCSTLPLRSPSASARHSATLPAIWSPWQRSRTLKKQSSRSDDNVYDLYAVCNHQGNMQGGHYTSYCKNPVDGRWFSFDDQKVAPMSEASVITADAYILFYQRASLSSSASCASSSTSGYSSSTSSYFDAHWTLRLSSKGKPSSPKSSPSLDDSAQPSQQTLGQHTDDKLDQPKTDTPSVQDTIEPATLTKKVYTITSV